MIQTMKSILIASALLIALFGSARTQDSGQQISLAHARVLLHSAPLVIPGAPVVAVRVRPCQFASCSDSVIEIEQVVDSSTHVTVVQWWYGSSTERDGWLERCRRDLATPKGAAGDYACPEPTAQAVIHGLWVEVAGPLPTRTRARLLAHLELAQPNAGP
jgi:hypothetical protein